MEQLIEQACDLYDWIALLWAACGEAPGKEWLANVNYRRALSSISDCRNLSWTTVTCDRNGYWSIGTPESRLLSSFPGEVRSMALESHGSARLVPLTAGIGIHLAWPVAIPAGTGRVLAGVAFVVCGCHHHALRARPFPPGVYDVRSVQSGFDACHQRAVPVLAASRVLRAHSLLSGRRPASRQRLDPAVGGSRSADHESVGHAEGRAAAGGKIRRGVPALCVQGPAVV